jgi:ESCRT-I complex subunit VPS28
MACFCSLPPTFFPFWLYGQKVCLFLAFWKTPIGFWVMPSIYDDEETEEVELYSSSRERQAYDDQATLYSIILATEHLERAYARDAVEQQEYVKECNKLISQFRLAEKAALAKLNMTTESFMQLYQMDCPRAVERLLIMGVPEPIRSSTGESADVAVTVAETVQHFITAMDAVKLESRFVDELQPLLSDLMDSLTRLPDCELWKTELSPPLYFW